MKGSLGNNFYILEGKIDSSLDDFSLKIFTSISPAEKSSRSEPFFFSENVKIIP